MPDKTLASKWLEYADHDYKAARILYENDHSLDTIAILLQQTLEKTLKSRLAFDKKKILKTHDLLELFTLVGFDVNLSDDELGLLETASDYYSEHRYPGAYVVYPEKADIEGLFELSQKIRYQIKILLGQ